ncbi:hypothetical protein YC2023_101321 [Brassica napus]|uniref:(rape) hypothetical protein n=1 Tax=Brassica napus TaxID=3708 RepID=A0A816UN17_BRANA|nr:unnamed protein product [Brassica napus]
MVERLRRRDLSVSGAKLGTVGRSRCVLAEKGGGGLEVSESRDKEGEAAEDAYGGRG